MVIMKTGGPKKLTPGTQTATLVLGYIALSSADFKYPAYYFLKTATSTKGIIYE